MKKRFFAFLCILVLIVSIVPADAAKPNICKGNHPGLKSILDSFPGTCNLKSWKRGYCIRCGEYVTIVGGFGDHDYSVFNGCQAKKKCKYCGTPGGEWVDHDVLLATCSYVTHCTKCSWSSGPLNPNWHLEVDSQGYCKACHKKVN